MHMADSLISPAVGGTLWAAAGSLIAFCSRNVMRSPRDNLIPLMGVLGAFVFAAQMINFSIPGTGSSGHLGGGLLLSVLLGPHAAFVVIASVLTVQAFFFADGGLLALGCNIFNLGFFPAFVAYPLVYRAIARDRHGTTRAGLAAVCASVTGLLLGAFSVVLETQASGLSDLPFGPFALVMLPIHLAIGIIEGVATAAVVSFVARARPEALPSPTRGILPSNGNPIPDPMPGHGLKPVLAGLAVAALFTGGVASWFASPSPDGLEWSVARVTGQAEWSGPATGLHKRLADAQSGTAILPNYGFKTSEPARSQPWPAVNAGTSTSGIVGGLMTLGILVLLGSALTRFQNKGRQSVRVP
jgi:cobalt/nickel transport system permease protein